MTDKTQQQPPAAAPQYARVDVREFGRRVREDTFAQIEFTLDLIDDALGNPDCGRAHLRLLAKHLRSQMEHVEEWTAAIDMSHGHEPVPLPPSERYE